MSKTYKKTTTKKTNWSHHYGDQCLF